MCVDEDGRQHAYSVAAAAHPQRLDCADARRGASDHAAAVSRLPWEHASLLHADLRLLDAAIGVRTRGAGRRCRPPRPARTWAFGMAKAGGDDPGARLPRSTATTISTPALRLIIARASRSASGSCCTGEGSARTSG